MILHVSFYLFYLLTAWHPIQPEHAYVTSATIPPATVCPATPVPAPATADVHPAPHRGFPHAPIFRSATAVCAPAAPECHANQHTRSEAQHSRLFLL